MGIFTSLVDYLSNAMSKAIQPWTEDKCKELVDNIAQLHKDGHFGNVEAEGSDMMKNTYINLLKVTQPPKHMNLKQSEGIRQKV